MVDRLREGAAAIHARPFSLRLDEIGWWRKPQVVWLAARQIPEDLLELAAAVNTLTRTQSIRTDNRPYRAHLTIARKAGKKPAESACRPVDWRIDSFCLVQSNTLPDGAVYDIIGTWPLSSA